MRTSKLYFVLFYILILVSPLDAQDYDIPFHPMEKRYRDITPLDKGFIAKTPDEAQMPEQFQKQSIDESPEHSASTLTTLEQFKIESIAPTTRTTMGASEPNHLRFLSGDFFYMTHSIMVVAGWGYDDAAYNNNTDSGALTMIRFEHFHAWRYGDNYLYSDFTYGDRLDIYGNHASNHSVYTEVHPRLSYQKILGSEALPQMQWMKDLLLAGQFHVNADGYQAYLLGANIDLNLADFTYFKLGFYLKDDTLNQPNIQYTTSWMMPFQMINRDFTFDGFLDVAGTDQNGLDLDGRFRILMDISQTFGLRTGTLASGIECYFHHNRHVDTYAPGIVFKGNF